MEALAPANSLSANYHENNDDIIQSISRKFSILRGNDLDAIINQWNTIVFPDLPQELRNPDIGICDFWFEVYYYEDDNGDFLLRSLIKFFLGISSIPHSNVETERVE